MLDPIPIADRSGWTLANAPRANRLLGASRESEQGTKVTDGEPCWYL